MLWSHSRLVIYFHIYFCHISNIYCIQGQLRKWIMLKLCHGWRQANLTAAISKLNPLPTHCGFMVILSLHHQGICVHWDHGSSPKNSRYFLDPWKLTEPWPLETDYQIFSWQACSHLMSNSTRKALGTEGQGKCYLQGKHYKKKSCRQGGY